jgi:hypothetical protein
VEEKSATSNTTKKNKPGAKAKGCDCKALAARVTNLENCLSKMAHFTGTNRVLDEFGIPRWEVTQESMRKRKG